MLLGHLFFGVANVYDLVRAVLGPLKALFVFYEVKNVEDVAEVDETIPFACFFVLTPVHGVLHLVGPVLVVFLEFLLDFVLLVPTRNILDHQGCSSFLRSLYLFDID